MDTIKDYLGKNNTGDVALIMFYENTEEKPNKLYRLLSFVIENYICIDYLACQSKTFSSISSKSSFEKTSFNIILGIFIPELLLNLLYCHGFIKKPNSNVILNC